MLPEDLWEEVRILAAERGISASQLIREAVLATLLYERGGNKEFIRALKSARD